MLFKSFATLIIMKFGSRMCGKFYLWKDDITFVLFHSTAPTGDDQGLSSIKAKSTEPRIWKREEGLHSEKVLTRTV